MGVQLLNHSIACHSWEPYAADDSVPAECMCFIRTASLANNRKSTSKSAFLPDRPQGAALRHSEAPASV